jgi:hypothetical protein
MTDNGSSGSPPPGSSASERAKLRMKLFSSEAETSSSNNSNDDDDDGSVVNFYTSSNTTPATPRGDGGVKYYNHFTTPFTPSTNTSTSITNENVMPTTTDQQQQNQQQQQQQQQTSVFSDLQRSQTVDRFITILTNQLSFALSSGKLTHAWKKQPPPLPNAAATKNENTTVVIEDYYGLERNIIMPHITPFVWGGSAILVTLFSLRFGRWYQSYSTNYSSSSLLSLSSVVGGRINSSSSSNSVGGIGNMIRRYIDGSRNSNSSSKYYHPPNPHNIHQSSSTIQDVRQQQIPLLNSSMKYNTTNTAAAGSKVRVGGVGKGEDVFQSIGSLLVDISLSILFGISTTLFLIDRYQLLHDVASMPLRILTNNDNDDNETTIGSIGSRNVNKNKSVIVEELCIPFSIEMDKINTSSMIVVRPNTPHRRHDKDEEEDNKEIEEDTATTTEEIVSYSELWKDENLNDYITLRSIRDFVTNCHIYDTMKKEKKSE